MSGTVNRVTLIGYVDRDPEVRDFQFGGQVCNFTVKTSERWKDRQTGEEREVSQWNRVSVYVAPMIDTVMKKVKQGDLIYIEGKMETRKGQDRMGNDTRWTEVSVRPYHGSVVPLVTGGVSQGQGIESPMPRSTGGSRTYSQSNESDDAAGGYAGTKRDRRESSTSQTRRTSADESFDADDDDDIPF